MKILFFCVLLVFVLALAPNVSAFSKLCLTEGQFIPPGGPAIYTCEHDRCELCVNDGYYSVHPSKCNEITSCDSLDESDNDNSNEDNGEDDSGLVGGIVDDDEDDQNDASDNPNSDNNSGNDDSNEGDNGDSNDGDSNSNSNSNDREESLRDYGLSVLSTNSEEGEISSNAISLGAESLTPSKSGVGVFLFIGLFEVLILGICVALVVKLKQKDKGKKGGKK
tara:strand:- start:4104 stop:4769 length:666 start_codon:yes stop_codon:yes gene_type:complete